MRITSRATKAVPTSAPVSFRAARQASAATCVVAQSLPSATSDERPATMPSWATLRSIALA